MMSLKNPLTILFLLINQIWLSNVNCLEDVSISRLAATTGRSSKASMTLLQEKYRSMFARHGVPPVAKQTSGARRRPLPDISSIITNFPKDSFIYSFTPRFMEAFTELAAIISDAPTASEMLDTAEALRTQVHSHLWYYALSSSVVRRPELQGLHKVGPYQALPHMYFQSEVLNGTTNGTGQSSQSCLIQDERVGVDNGIENLLWYFRESIPINSHHWYYHLSYPISSRVRLDRHGELFSFLHGQMLARYNAEKLSNGMSRATEIFPLEQGIPVGGYNSHLNDENSGRNWAPRQAFTPLNDAIHEADPELELNILLATQLRGARDRILSAIASGFVVDQNNSAISIQNLEGINLLGELVQATNWSVNPAYYGFNTSLGIHNNGHLLISCLADPWYFLRLPLGVMAEEATSMRDPIFYRWHTFINRIFITHKDTLVPYSPSQGELPLLWPGITLEKITLTSSSGANNLVKTFWTQTFVKLEAGLDFSRKPEMPVCLKQLDHEAFNYTFRITKGPSVTTTRATVRIFLAPRHDEVGNRMRLSDQRHFFVILDSFTVYLNPGLNVVSRRSNESTLTIPFDQTIYELNENPNNGTPYCGCGWPQNMLIPKGTSTGMLFDLFVMLTNGDDDFVQQPGPSPPASPACIPAPPYCGLANQLYPDAKPMGYPFDRKPYTRNGRMLKNVGEYVNGISNMGTIPIRIQFTGRI